MPKDPTRNIDRYKIRGGDINEFEYDQNQRAFAEPKAKGATNLIPGTPPEEKAQKTTKQSAKKQMTKASKSTKKTTKKAAVSARGASAKKLAARKAAKKK